MSRLFAAVYDPLMRGLEAEHGAGWRSALLSGLAGSVLEIGAGTGANVGFYPAQVDRLVLTEPDPHMRRRLSAKVAGSSRGRADRVEIAQASVDTLAFPAHSFDAVVATLVLCSVPDLERAIATVLRVLRPGGTLVMLEHVAEPERPDILRWQQRVEPFWKRIAGNCHLTRSTDAALQAAGLRFCTKEVDIVRGALPIVRKIVRGIAQAP